MFISTAVSRLTPLAAVLIWQARFGAAVLVPLSLTPSILFLLMKPCTLTDLSVVDLVKAVLGEMTTHSLWGGRGREGSKMLQLFMQIYLLILHSAFMLMIFFNVHPIFAKDLKASASTLERLQIGAIVSLATCWPSRVVLTSL